MGLHRQTLDNAADRRRFVSAELAQPYLTGRQRANLQRTAQQAKAAVMHALTSSHYGTAQRLRSARAALSWVQHWLSVEEQLAAVPPPGETAHTPTVFALAAE